MGKKQRLRKQRQQKADVAAKRPALVMRQSGPVLPLGRAEMHGKGSFTPPGGQ